MLLGSVVFKENHLHLFPFYLLFLFFLCLFLEMDVGKLPVEQGVWDDILSIAFLVLSLIGDFGLLIAGDTFYRFPQFFFLMVFSIAVYFWEWNLQVNPQFFLSLVISF